MSYKYNPLTGELDIVGGSSGGGVEPQVEYRTITSGEESSKSLTLASTPSDPTTVILDVAGGPAQVYGDDFTVSGDVLSWSGLGLDGLLEENDQLRIVYFV